MTSTGMVMGTPHYMSPEQVRGAKADARSDVFALGCVLYEMLTGRKPFDAESMHAVLFKILQEEPVPLREAAPGTPESLVDVVERALAKNPAERFENAGEMLVGIRQAQQAVAAGRGHERAPGFERPPAGAPSREPARAPARERSHASGVPRNTVSPGTGAGGGGRSSPASGSPWPRFWSAPGPCGATCSAGPRHRRPRPPESARSRSGRSTRRSSSRAGSSKPASSPTPCGRRRAP